jgi:hypothetical protein
MKSFCGRFLPFLLFFGVTQAAFPGEYTDDMLKRLPDTTNVLITANVEALRKAVGVAEGTSLVGVELGSLPVAANDFVLGMHLDLSERRHVWSLSLAHLTRPIKIDDIAKAEGEGVEEIAGYKVVASPRNVYFIDLGNGLLAAGTPAELQRLKKWLAFQKRNQVVALSSYLTQAVNSSEPPLMALAMDMTDSMDPKSIRRGLNASQVMANRRNVNYEEVTKTLARVRGLTFTIQPGSPMTGELTVDFDTDTRPIRAFAKPLLLEILQHANLYLPELGDWQGVLKNRSIGIKGNLSLNGLRKVCTLIRTPAPAPEAADMQSYMAGDPKYRAQAASQRYFKSITKLLDELQADKTKNVKSQAGWYDQYATQIDKLPILDVDPMLIKYGGEIGQHLRAMGASLQGIDLQSGYLQRQKAVGQVYQAPNYTGNYNGYWGSGYGPYTSYGGYYGGWGANLANNMAVYRAGAAGGINTYDNFETVRKQQDALVTQGNAARVGLWERIDNETAEVRRQMTLKYKVEF